MGETGRIRSRRVLRIRWIITHVEFDIVNDFNNHSLHTYGLPLCPDHRPMFNARQEKYLRKMHSHYAKLLRSTQSLADSTNLASHKHLQDFSTVVLAEPWCIKSKEKECLKIAHRATLTALFAKSSG